MDIEAQQQNAKRKKTKLKTAESFICFGVRLNEDLLKFIDIALSQFVRLVYVLETGFCVYLLASVMQNNYYYLMLIGTLVIILDGYFVLIVRHGKEYTW